MTKRLHAGAKNAFRFTAILCYCTILGAPFAAWLQYRVSRARVTVDGNALDVRCVFKSIRLRFDEIERVGTLGVRLTAGGIAGVYARRKVGGPIATQLWIRTRAGKTRRFVVSMYEDFEAIAAEISSKVGKPLEPVAVGTFGPKWAA
ncbi:MAG TPA: hypothetical protein VGG74_25185 [Kofleriaceae bacterium]|jgi:hypothetical protein